MPTRDQHPSGGPSLLRRPVPRIAAVWLLTATAVLAFAAVTAVGPILLSFSGTHGIHLGDVVALLFGSAIAGGATIRLLRVGR